MALWPLSPSEAAYQKTKDEEEAKRMNEQLARDIEQTIRRLEVDIYDRIQPPMQIAEHMAWRDEVPLTTQTIAIIQAVAREICTRQMRNDARPHYCEPAVY